MFQVLFCFVFIDFKGVDFFIVFFFYIMWVVSEGVQFICEFVIYEEKFIIVIVYFSIKNSYVVVVKLVKIGDWVYVIEE